MPNKKSKGKKQGQEKNAKQTQAVQPILVSEETLIFDPTSSTPFDDVFKTLLYDHTRLVIPLVNKAFHENYTGDERIEFRPHEHLINKPGGEQEKRILDCYFLIWRGDEHRAYIIECQTNADGTILIRLFEYSFLAALDGAAMEGNVLRVPFPRMVLIVLRSQGEALDEKTVLVEFPDGQTVNYKPHIVDVKGYTADELFDEELLILEPFHIFAHEARFPEYEADEGKLDALVAEYERISQRIEEQVQQGKLTEYTALALREMTRKVLDHLAAKHKKVRERLGATMGGTVLEYEAKTIYNQGHQAGVIEGHQAGIIEGEARGTLNTLFALVEDQLIPLDVAASRVHMTEDEFKGQMQMFKRRG